LPEEAVQQPAGRRLRGVQVEDQQRNDDRKYPSLNASARVVSDSSSRVLCLMP
jgi:hypothetical protein